jgi:hypothetical protein
MKFVIESLICGTSSSSKIFSTFGAVTFSSIFAEIAYLKSKKNEHFFVHKKFFTSKGAETKTRMIQRQKKFESKLK